MRQIGRLDDAAVIGVGQIFIAPDDCGHRVVDPDIDAAKSIHDTAARLLDELRIGHIARHADHSITRPFQLVNGVEKPFNLSGDHHDLPSGPGEPVGYGETDAGARACDDDDRHGDLSDLDCGMTIAVAAEWEEALTTTRPEEGCRLSGDRRLSRSSAFDAGANLRP